MVKSATSIQKTPTYIPKKLKKKITNPTESSEDLVQSNQIKKLRHGNGIQIFFRSDGSILSRYEGKWTKGEKVGECTLIYADGSHYIGSIRGDKKEGNGKYIWPNGDFYDGTWRDNRMDGTGSFHKHNGGQFVGTFRNNNFHMGGTRYINPLNSDEEIQEFMNKADEHEKIRDLKFNKKTHINESVKHFIPMRDNVDKSNANYRIPLLVSTKSTGMRIADLHDGFRNLGVDVSGFDLRKAWWSHRNGNLESYKKIVKNTLAKAMVMGEYFFISIDDTDIKFEEAYDPDFKEYYNKDSFPYQILSLKELKIAEVYKKVLADTEFEGKKISPNFRIALWSKFKVEDNIDMNKMKDKIERRFGRLLPLERIDMIIFRQSQNTMMWGKSSSKFVEGQYFFC